jgi:hypothetical protein
MKENAGGSDETILTVAKETEYRKNPVPIRYEIE